MTFSTGGSPVKKTLSIENVVKESISFILSGTNVNLDFSFDENLHAVNVDQGQIGQVFQNIAINANQAMPKGGTLNINVKNIQIGEDHELPLEAGDYIKISIEDQGVGISRKNLEKIFDPYFSTKKEGSGLGLATAYSIIKMHDGYIEVKSEVNKGTTFLIYLPSSKERIVESSEEEEGGKILIKPKKIRRILLMDDEEVIRSVAKEMLGELGYDLVFALDGEEALDLYKRAFGKSNSFDVVIIDLTIPGGMGGKEAIKKLLEIDPEVSAIVSSGYSNDPVMSNFAKYGFKGVLQKPFKFDELKEILTKFESI